MVELVRKVTGTGTIEAPLRNPIAYIAEAADDLAYSSVDLEDAIRKKVMVWDELEEGLIKEAKDLGVEPQMKSILDNAVKLIDDYEELPMSEWDRAEGYAIMFRTLIIAEGVNAVVKVFKENYDKIMSGELNRSLLSLNEAGLLVKSAKRYAASNIYPKTSTLELLGRNVIHDLMDFFWAEVKDYSTLKEKPHPKSFRAKTINMMSSNYRHVYESQLKDGRLPKRYIEFQLITDYICGMTDTFACSLHRKLFNG